MNPINLSENPMIGYGAECQVYDIGGNKCCKIYSCAAEAHDAYSKAKLAADSGIGPDVYEYNENYYVTEIVYTLVSFCSNCDMLQKCYVLCDELIQYIGEDSFHKMLTTANKIFDTMFVDLHSNNIGIKNGKPVLIDFGYASF